MGRTIVARVTIALRLQRASYKITCFAGFAYLGEGYAMGYGMRFARNAFLPVS